MLHLQIPDVIAYPRPEDAQVIWDSTIGFDFIIKIVKGYYVAQYHTYNLIVPWLLKNLSDVFGSTGRLDG